MSDHFRQPLGICMHTFSGTKIGKVAMPQPWNLGFIYPSQLVCYEQQAGICW
jgi:hypothetical protein